MGDVEHAELQSGSSGPGSSPGHIIVLCSLMARHFTLTVPISAREYNGYQQTVRET